MQRQGHFFLHFLWPICLAFLLLTLLSHHFDLAPACRVHWPPPISPQDMAAWELRGAGTAPLQWSPAPQSVAGSLVSHHFGRKELCKQMCASWSSHCLQMSGASGGLGAARGGLPSCRDGRAGCVEWRGGGDTMSLCPGLGLAPGTCNYRINAASIFCCCCCWSCCCCICCNIRSGSTGWLGAVASRRAGAALSML